MSDEEYEKRIQDYAFTPGNIFRRYQEAGYPIGGEISETNSHMPIIYTIFGIPFFSLMAFGALAFSYYMLGFGSRLTPTIIESNWYLILGVIYLIVTHFCYKNLLQKVANDNASTYWNRGTNAVLIQLDEARKNFTKKEFEEVLKSSTGGYIERPMKED